MKTKEMLETVKKELANVGITDSAEAEWLVALTLGIKRNDVFTLANKELEIKQQEKVEKLLTNAKNICHLHTLLVMQSSMV